MLAEFIGLFGDEEFQFENALLVAVEFHLLHAFQVVYLALLGLQVLPQRLQLPLVLLLYASSLLLAAVVAAVMKHTTVLTGSFISLEIPLTISGAGRYGTGLLQLCYFELELV